MDPKKQERISDLAEAGLAACLLKLSFVAAGEWRLESVSVLDGAPAAWAAHTAGVRVGVSSVPPFTTALFYSGEDLSHLAACYAGDQLPALAGDGRLVTLLEVGNIVLNALINSLLKALKKSAIPSVPEVIAGPAAAAAGLPPGGPLCVISASVTAVRDGRSAKVEIAALLPLPLADQL